MANVMVTGGTRGIGAGIVEKLLSEGHNVAFCGRVAPEEMTGKLADLCARYSGKAAYCQGYGAAS